MLQAPTKNSILSYSVRHLHDVPHAMQLRDGVVMVAMPNSLFRDVTAVIHLAIPTQQLESNQRHRCSTVGLPQNHFSVTKGTKTHRILNICKEFDYLFSV